MDQRNEASRTQSWPAPTDAQGTIPSSQSDPLDQRIEHENLDDKTYERIRAMIIDRRITPGERINVDRIASNLGVSRTPVVNALKRLRQEHVVEWVQRRGVYVRRFAMRELARLTEVREMLEGLAARRAATRISRVPRRACGWACGSIWRSCGPSKAETGRGPGRPCGVTQRLQKAYSGP